MHGAKATCKRTQQLPILFARQYWELLWQCWWVVCKQLQTLLGPAVHRGKDTTHKTLETMCNARAWLQQYWKSCANGSNIVALRFGDHRTKEILGVVGSKFWTVSNFAEQHATTCNNKQHGVQTDATCNIQQCCGLLASNVASMFARGMMHKKPPCIFPCVNDLFSISQTWRACSQAIFQYAALTVLTRQFLCDKSDIGCLVSLPSRLTDCS